MFGSHLFDSPRGLVVAAAAAIGLILTLLVMLWFWPGILSLPSTQSRAPITEEEKEHIRQQLRASLSERGAIDPQIQADIRAQYAKQPPAPTLTEEEKDSIRAQVHVQ